MQLNNVRIRLLHNVNNCNSSVHIVVIGLLHYFKHRRALSSIPCDNTPSLRTTRCRAIAPLIISNSLYLRLSETIWLRLHLSFRCAKEVIRRIRDNNLTPRGVLRSYTTRSCKCNFTKHVIELTQSYSLAVAITRIQCAVTLHVIARNRGSVSTLSRWYVVRRCRSLTLGLCNDC